MKKILYYFKKIKNKNNGMTLIEMMVVVAILSIIILGLVTFFTGGARSWIAGQSQLKAQREARQVMDRIVREIREGKNATCITSPPGVTIDYPDAFSESSVTFAKSGNVVYRNSLSNTLISNVKNFNVTCIDNSKVSILLEIDVDNDDKPDISLESDINLRNYGLLGS